MYDGVLFGASRFVDELFQPGKGIVPNSGRLELQQWWEFSIQRLGLPLLRQHVVCSKAPWREGDRRQPHTEPLRCILCSTLYKSCLLCSPTTQCVGNSWIPIPSPASPPSSRPTSPTSSWQMCVHTQAMPLTQGGHYRHLQHQIPLLHSTLYFLWWLI